MIEVIGEKFLQKMKIGFFNLNIYILKPLIIIFIYSMVQNSNYWDM